jgi:spore coat polysaccharide biosynthesis protein SpsF (cytidylyltransferase family)
MNSHQTTKVVAFILARMGSSRFPGKVLENLINDTPVLGIMHRRVNLATMVDMTVVATSTEPQDDVVAQYCADAGIPCFRGPEEDVFERIVQAVSAFEAEIIVDLTADCPLVDPLQLDIMIHRLKADKLDYVSNVVPRMWPDGLDVQVYKRGALLRLVEEQLPINREHTGWNFTHHPKKFKSWTYEPHVSHFHPEWGLTLDYPEDLELLRLIFEVFYTQENSYLSFSIAKVLDFLNRYPWVLDVNKGCRRNVPTLEG